MVTNIFFVVGMIAQLNCDSMYDTLEVIEW